MLGRRRMLPNTENIQFEGAAVDATVVNAKYISCAPTNARNSRRLHRRFSRTILDRCNPQPDSPGPVGR